MFKPLKTLIFTVSVSALLAFNPTNAYADEVILVKSDASITVNVKLKGYLFGFKVLRAEYETAYSETGYRAQAILKTAGLGAFLKKFKIWSATSGRITGTELSPHAHVQQNMNKKHRRVQMAYTENSVHVDIVPRLGSQGVPMASDAQRFESDDTLSALLNLMMRGSITSKMPCTGSIPVFDSKQHYNLRMENAGTRRIRQKGYKGDTIRCHVFYEPVSGFDPEDLPNAEEVAAPITMYLAHFEEAGLYIPVRMTYKISGFKAVIKAREITIFHNANTAITPLGPLAALTNPFVVDSSTPDHAAE
ncbi:MAG: hypothetical protein COA69_06055 [Robiginitomaculum sp.]|nr:MAG: hypothetical protein COA69_06055 [Robiginitomaculum sp.]